jgi:hypothetical protein
MTTIDDGEISDDIDEDVYGLSSLNPRQMKSLKVHSELLPDATEDADEPVDGTGCCPGVLSKLGGGSGRVQPADGDNPLAQSGFLRTLSRSVTRKPGGGQPQDEHGNGMQDMAKLPGSAVRTIRIVRPITRVPTIPPLAIGACIRAKLRARRTFYPDACGQG